MPRKNKNARKVKYRGKRIRSGPRTCWIQDDGIRPGWIVAAAEYVGQKKKYLA